ncbi:MAG: response regulator [Candidatus Saccharibacteria bacterium]|nr:response regulator [Candidatus Saccharibacteria bacterium]
MKRVLIVEDDPAWAALLQRYMAAIGAESAVVSSPGQAIVAVDEWAPDALCMDMLLAGETGMALLYELQSHDDLAALSVVVCSGVALDVAELTAFGVRAVLDKSRVTPGEVMAALREVLT